MTCHDRVVRTTDGDEEWFAIDEVFYDDNGRPETRTEEPAHPAGETLEGLAEDLTYYQAALSQPVLDDTVFRRAAGHLFGAEEP
jgi:hypothetical protein